MSGYADRDTTEYPTELNDPGFNIFHHMQGHDYLVVENLFFWLGLSIFFSLVIYEVLQLKFPGWKLKDYINYFSQKD